MEKDDVVVVVADVVVVVAMLTMMLPLTMTMINTVDHDDLNIVVADCFKLYFVCLMAVQVCWFPMIH